MRELHFFTKDVYLAAACIHLASAPYNKGVAQQERKAEGKINIMFELSCI